VSKYLITASYSPEGARGVLKAGGSSRREAVGKLVDGVGGNMEGFYFGFGEVDAYVLVDLPDNETAAAVALAVNSSGATHVSTVVLMTPEEVDAATSKSVDYRPPGS
jgi:uncharacterized protein with GYD domain